MGYAYALTSCEQTGWCECVVYVRQQSGWTNFPQTPPDHEAYRWWSTAQGNGYAVGNKPMVGAVLVWKGWSKNAAGHVAITASIVSDTEITVNHANWANPLDGKVRLGIKVTDVSEGNWTKVKVNDGSTEYEVYGFIYPKNPPVTSGSVCLGMVCGDAALYRVKLKTAQMVRFGLEMISVTDVGWRPLTERCEEAQQYFYLAKSSPTSQKFMAMPAPSSICANVVQACFAQ
ncbi:MAG: CHAP domain-containing protein [Candidatus Moraniibacteriota bacterium]